MKRIKIQMHKGVVSAAIALGFVLGLAPMAAISSMAEEAPGYYDEAGDWVEQPSEEQYGIFDDAFSEEGEASGATTEMAQTELTGTYTVEDGWSEDEDASAAGRIVYRQDAYTAVEDTSTISCSYMDTNYSVLEYEQLRDMLKSNLVYDNVSAQISSSAVYTNAKDYLYILIVDDTSQEYRTVYCYVVGDYRCFCAEVKEYRAEADQLRAAQRKTPQEVCQAIAESFVWNS